LGAASITSSLFKTVNILAKHPPQAGDKRDPVKTGPGGLTGNRYR
jgi:hypothetical protein